VWDTDSESEVLRGHTLDVHALAVLPESRLASGSVDRTVRIWDLVNADCLFTFNHISYVRHLASLPGGILAGSSDDKISVWDPTNGALITSFDTWEVTSMKASPNGDLVTGVYNRRDFFDRWSSNSTRIRVWE
jgi:WD40 repeat protein